MMNLEQVKLIGGLTGRLKAQTPFYPLLCLLGMLLIAGYWYRRDGFLWLASMLLVGTAIGVAVLICILVVVFVLRMPLRLQSELFQLQYKALELAEQIARSTKLRPASAADILNAQIELIQGHPPQSKDPPRQVSQTRSAA
jgi:hypothetical protein